MKSILSTFAIFIAFAFCADEALAQQQRDSSIAPSFYSGRLELKQSWLGNGAAGGAKLYALYQEGSWESLVKEVIAQKYVNDLYYFYLGRAAEGLGYPEAAMAYYVKSTQVKKCFNAVYHECKDDIPLPQTAINRRSDLLDFGATKFTTFFGSFTEAKLINFPELETVREVDVGDSMISSIFENIRPALKLQHGLVELKAGYLWGGETLDVDVGTFPLAASSGDAYFFESGTVAWNGVDKSPVYIFLSKKDNLSNKFCLKSPSRPDTLNCYESAELLEGDGYQRLNLESFSSVSFRRELVYTGKSQGAITLLYREFKDDMARPAFTQELKYDISKEPVIGFKGARFEILKATNTGITYKTLRYLN